MLQRLDLTNVGPAPKLCMELGSRLNLLTGDNGLGKSFLLDIAWWALTRKWPAEVNKTLPGGLMARPTTTSEARIEFSFTAKSGPYSYRSTFNREAQAWAGRSGRPPNPGLVLYAMVDGSFAVWDPARNYWRKKGNIDVQDRPPAYVFNAREVWDGLKDGERGLLCNGLIVDWAGWQKEKGDAFNLLKAVLAAVSPSPDETIEPGELTRISLDDPRDIPTLKMPYGQSVPVLHASAGIRRIIALAYLLVWAWQEHGKASVILGQPRTNQIIFLIDEIEAHLHPKWQRRIIQALLSVMTELTSEAEVQLITATHSPLVMASVEPFFDPGQDAWFDLDLVVNPQQGTAKVELAKRHFVRMGDAAQWLMSEAFDLDSAGSLEAGQARREAASALANGPLDTQQIRDLDDRLRQVLSDTDPFWMRWRFVGEQRGWF